MVLRITGTFQARVAQFQRDLRRRALPMVVVQYTRRLYENLRLLNPVDTGFMRQNWNVSLDATEAETFGTYNRNVDFPDVDRFTLVPDQITEDVTEVFVYNGTPYGQIVNYGNELRAPTYFVRDAINKTLLL